MLIMKVLVGQSVIMFFVCPISTVLIILFAQVSPEDDDKRPEAPSSDKITFSLLQTLILEEYGMINHYQLCMFTDMIL